LMSSDHLLHMGVVGSIGSGLALGMMSILLRGYK
jgi:hypothetical protein